MLHISESSRNLIGQRRPGIHQSLCWEDGGRSRRPNSWGRCLVAQTPYLGRQRPHPAGCRPLWCGSPWWRLLHPAAPRRCWRWRCCCSCSCSSLCGTAALTPFSKTPVPWMIRRGGGWGGDIHTVFVRIPDYVYRMKWFSDRGRTRMGYTIQTMSGVVSNLFLCKRLKQIGSRCFFSSTWRCHTDVPALVAAQKSAVFIDWD